MLWNSQQVRIHDMDKGSAGDRYFYVDVRDATGIIAPSEALNVKIDTATPVCHDSETVSEQSTLTTEQHLEADAHISS